MTAAGCHGSSSRHASFLAMGTRVDITLQDCNDRQAATAIASAEHEMHRWSKDWYAWGDGTGELERLNDALVNSQSFSASPELLDLITKSKQLSIDSDGYFDPAVAPLIKRWGVQNPDHPPSQLPTAQQLDQWTKSHPSMQDIQINGTQIVASRPDIQIDLGAIAKGYALDKMMMGFKKTGISNAVVNLGGQVILIGNIERSKRKVSIRDPRLTQLIASIELRDGESISTSGDYERSFVKDGRRVHHILDPHTGTPVNETQMVTVIGNDGTTADAASTAIMAAGTQWQAIARRLHISQVLRVDTTGEIELTTAMYTRLKSQYPALHTHKLVIVN